MPKKCISCIVSGRVQGVFFRESTRREADRLGITGWVRNRADGTVEVTACGEENAVKTLRDWLTVGPPHARVTGVECRDLTEAETFDDFQVR